MTYKNGEIIFDKYRIERLIGEGMFGEVYLVTHPKLNVKRVIKLIRHDTMTKNDPNYRELRRQFQQEAQIGARINHPALIRVYDFDESEDLMSIAMEYAAGGSLLSLIAEKNISSGSTVKPGLEIPLIIEIAKQIAEGLAVIHSMDIVHRDLKPSNILFDETGQVKIADLGLAQIKDSKSQSSQSESQLIRSSHPGTPAYMSPEQENSRLYLSTSSDVYSYGLILFEMLTGRLYKNLKPGTRVTDLRPDTPDWLSDLINHCLVDDPAQRLWSGEDLVKLFLEPTPNMSQPVIQPVSDPVIIPAVTEPDSRPTSVTTPLPKPQEPTVAEKIEPEPAVIPDTVQIFKQTSDDLSKKVSRLDFRGFFQKFRLQLAISALVVGIILVILFSTSNSLAASPITAIAPKSISPTSIPTKKSAVVYAFPTLDAAGKAKLDKQILGKWNVTRVVGFPAKGRPWQDAGNTLEFLSNGILKIQTYDGYSDSNGFSMEDNLVTFTFKDGHKDVWVVKFYDFQNTMQLQKDGTEEIYDLIRIK